MASRQRTGLCSEPGKGATFKIYFPRVNESPSPVHGSVASSGKKTEPQGQGVLLLAEDDEALRLYVSGYTENAIVHGGTRDAGVEFLNKPCKMADLAAKIREILVRSRTWQPPALPYKYFPFVWKAFLPARDESAD